MFNEISFYEEICAEDGSLLASKPVAVFTSMFDVNQSSSGQLYLEIDSLADAFQDTSISRFDFFVALGNFFWSTASGRCCYESYKLAKKLGALPEVAESRLTALKNNPFFNKMFVITGTLWKMDRTEALFEIRKRGGRTSDNPINSMEYLILGNQEWSDLNNGVASRKVQKAAELRDKGKNIQIISEDDFYKMLDEVS